MQHTSQGQDPLFEHMIEQDSHCKAEVSVKDGSVAIINVFGMQKTILNEQ
jgi:hypothetical protein